MNSCMRLVSLIPLTLILSGCVTMTNSTQARYMDSWSSRYNQYVQQFREQETRIVADDKGLGSEFTAAPTNKKWETLVSGVFRVGGEIKEAFRIAGHGQTVHDFMDHMRTQPTPGLTDVWFSRKAEDLKQTAQKVDTTTKAFLASFNTKIKQGPNWIKEAEEIFRAQGMLQGSFEELSGLHSEAVAYYSDLQVAQIEDQRRALQTQAALAGAAGYFNQLNYQQQLLNTLNQPRTCRTFGNSITCY